jgi:hypothetical protein
MSLLERLLIRFGLRSVYSGGDGSSRETAIVIRAGNIEDGIRAEYEYIRRLRGPRDGAWKRDVQIRTSAQGRHYDLVSVILRDGTKEKFWFDITRCYGDWRL